MTGAAPPQRGKRLPFCAPAKSTRFKTRQAARTTRRMSGSGPKARFLAMYMPRCGVRKKGLGSWFYRLDGNRSPAEGKRLPFCAPAKSARFKTRQAARTTRRMSGSGPSACFLAMYMPRCGVRKKGLGPWFYRLDGNRSPTEGEAAPVLCAGKVGALQNQASGAHAAAAEFGGGAWAPGSTAWTGAASPQGEAAPVSRTGKVGAL